MAIGRALGVANRPQALSSNIVNYPAPHNGVDARIALAAGDRTHCIYAYNLLPSEYGMKVRKGYREYQIDVPGDEVRTIIPFDAVDQDGLSNRLFVTTKLGIYEVTNPGDAPVQVLPFTDTNPLAAGWGTYVHYTGQDENDVLYYADEVNGLFQYDVDANTWAQATGIVGPDITNVRFIMVHKNRLWLIEENTNYAWYLDINAQAGTAEEFYFGSKFENGGNVAGLFSWSIDGGAGNDDYMVCVSRAGDVLVYQGNNPANVEDWNLGGSYYIGQVPPGSSFGSVHGGDLYLLSIYGLNSMGELLQGVNSAALFNSSDTTSPSAKVAEIIKTQLARTVNKYGWAIRRIPSESGLLISGPQEAGRKDVQYFYKVTKAAWGFWRDVPLVSFDTWEGAVVFGTADGRVCLMDVTADNILLTPPAEGFNGDNIIFAVLTSYWDLGSPGLYKRVKWVRPDFISKQIPNIGTQARFDYDLNENVFPVAADTAGSDGGLWDIGLWDQALWGAGAGQNFAPIRGSWGMGRYVAVTMQGDTREETFLIGWDVCFDTGGPNL